MKETNGSELLRKCRKRRDDVETRGKLLTWDKPGRDLHTVVMKEGRPVCFEAKYADAISALGFKGYFFIPVM